MRRIAFIFVFLACFHVSTPLFEWLFGGKTAANTSPSGIEGNSDVDKNNPEFQSSTTAVLAEIPFEMRINDEKFLAQAEPYLGKQMSALDVCQHRIVLGLQKSCSHLSEEDLAKLGVNLLNCQSAVEGRKIYPCTKSMTLKDCTIEMDQDTWNSYHIISNRARALCYSLRQMQFTAKTELTVDRLVSSAQQQLASMAKLKDGQEKLEHITANTYDALATGHKELIQQQEFLKDSQRNVGWFVSRNLKDLAKEKAMIATGHKELASMTETIKSKLADAEAQLSKQDTERKGNHQEVLEELSQMRLKASDVWNQIDNSSKIILQRHLNTIHHYQEALQNLQQVNASINQVLSLVERTRLDVDSKLAWLMQLSKDAEGNMSVLLTCLVHLGYFLLGAIGAVFLEAPYVLRVVLLVTVPLNAFAEVEHGAGLDFTKLTAVVVSTSLCAYLAQVLIPWAMKRRPTLRTTSQILSFFKKKTVTKAVYKEALAVSDTNSEDSAEDQMDKLTSYYAKSNSLPRPRTVATPRESGDMPGLDQVTLSAVKTALFTNSDSDSNTMVLRSRSRSRDVTPIRSQTPPLVNTCHHVNKKGQPCKMTCRFGQEYCRVHCDTM